MTGNSGNSIPNVFAMPGALPPATATQVGSHHASPARDVSKIAWESLVDSLPFGLVILSPRQEVVHESAFCHHLLGCGISEKGGVEAWLSNLCPDREHKEKVIASWREHVWRNQLTRTFSLKGSDEKLREIEFRSSLQPDGGITLVLQDVTQERRTEETLRHGKLKFRALFTHLPSGTVLIDRRGRIVDANPAFQKLVGISLNRLRLTPFGDLLDRDDKTAVTRIEEEFFAATSVHPQQSESLEVTVSTTSGTRKTRLTLCPVGEPETSPSMGLYILEGTGNDEAEEKWAVKLRRVAARAQALLDAVSDLILLVNDDLTVADFSPPPRSWNKLHPDESWKGNNLDGIWPVLGELVKNTKSQVIGERKNVHAELKSCGSEFEVTLAACGDDQILAVVREKAIVAPVQTDQSVPTEFQWVQAQHHFRNQLQLVTSLFSLEPQENAARDAFLRWQIRLRCVARACPENSESELKLAELFRGVADEVCSLLGRGPGRREIVVSGEEDITIAVENATAMALLVGEVMRLVICKRDPGLGPQLFLKITEEPDGGFRMNAKTGSSAQFAFSGKEGETEILEVLTRQLHGNLAVSPGVDPRDEWDLIVPLCN